MIFLQYLFQAFQILSHTFRLLIVFVPFSGDTEYEVILVLMFEFK